MKRAISRVLATGALGLGLLALAHLSAAATKNDAAAPPAPTLEEDARAGLVNSKEMRAFAESAEAKYKRGDYRGAIEDCNQVIAALPRNATAYSFRGRVKAAAGDLAGARADCDHALALNPYYAPAYLNRSRIKEDKGDLAGAEADCRLALQMDPKNASGHIVMAFLKAERKDYAAAEAEFGRALASSPTSAPAYAGRSIVRSAQKRFADALADANRAVALDPKLPGGYTARGNCRLHMEDLVAAAADYRQARALAPANKINALHLAYAVTEQHHYPEALADVQDAVIRSEPRTEDYRQFLVWTLRHSLGRAGEADQNLSAYLAARPRSAEVRWSGFVGAFLLGRESEVALFAQAATGDGTKINGQRCEAWYYAGLKKLFAGDQAAADEDFRKCVATGEQTYYEYGLARGRLRSL